MCGDDGGRQQHRLVFYNTFITTICSTGGRYYSRLGVISQTEHLISLVIYNTLYKSILLSLCIMNPHTSAVYTSLKPTPRTHVRACPHYQNAGKPMATSEHAPIRLAQTHTTGGKLVRRYICIDSLGLQL